MKVSKFLRAAIVFGALSLSGCATMTMEEQQAAQIGFAQGLGQGFGQGLGLGVSNAIVDGFARPRYRYYDVPRPAPYRPYVRPYGYYRYYRH